MALDSGIAIDIRQRIQRTRRVLYTTDARAKLYWFGALLLTGLVVCTVFEMLFHLDSAARTALFFGVSAAIVAGVCIFIVLPLLRIAGIAVTDDDFAIARRVGSHFPAIRDGLTNFLQLQQEAKSGATYYSPDLLEASFADFARTVGSVDFVQAIDASDVVRMRKWFLGSIVCAVLFIAVFPASLSGAFLRLVHFKTEFTPPPKYSFAVLPGNKEIVKGESVPIRVQLTSPDRLAFRPHRLGLYYRMKGQERFDKLPMDQDSSGMYRAVLREVKYSTEYNIEAAEVQSSTYLLTVLDRPILRSLRVRLEFPAYTHLPERVQDDFSGDITALPGTRVLLEGLASKGIAGANVVFARDSSLRLSVSGNRFNGSFRLRADGTYFIDLRDLDSLSNSDPVHYTLKVIPDQWPTVAIVSPGRNLDIVGDQTLPLVIHAEDDFGFSRLRIGYRLTHSRFQEPQKDYTYLQVPIPPGQQTQLDVPYQWNLTGLDLVPEDVVEYFAEVFDNDAVSGPKSSKSNVYQLRLPSLQEVFSDVDEGHKQTQDNVRQAKETAQQLRDDIQSINNDIKQNKDISWQQQKKMESIAKKYQEIQKQLQGAQEKLDNMVQTMSQQKVLSQETMEKYIQLQQLFQELNSSELQNALKAMQQAMQNVSKEQLQQAMRQVTFSEERFREGIERTLELLKRIQIEEKVDEVRKRAQDLERVQQQLHDETAKASNDREKQEQLAAQQQDLAKKEQEMEQASQDLAKRMEEFFTEMPLETLNTMNKELQRQNLSQQMKNAGQQMQQGNLQQARQGQQQIQQSLSTFSQQMDALQQRMLQQQSQYVMNEMRKATNDLLALSKREEALKQQSKNSAPNSTQLRENAEDQLQLMQDLNHVTNGLQELSKRSFAVTPEMAKAIGDALMRMQDAMRELDIRNGQMASQEQGMAMAALNESAVQVQNALQAMTQGGMGGVGGLLQQLQMLAGSQMALNLKSEELGQGMSMQQAAQAARLAQEQEAIKKSLDQLNQEAKESQQQQNILGDLNKIGQEMEEVVSNMEQNNVGPETLQKQRRILSRLLDASKSMNERDYEKRRTSRPGTQIAGKSPNALNAEEVNASDRLRDDLQKALRQGYSKDYQELIRRYFEELQKAQNVTQ